MKTPSDFLGLLLVLGLLVLGLLDEDAAGWANGLVLKKASGSRGSWIGAAGRGGGALPMLPNILMSITLRVEPEDTEVEGLRVVFDKEEGRL